MSSWWQDLRYAARALRKAPGFTFVASIVLALGIGANSAIFSLADAALLRALPFDQSDRLMMLWERSPRYAHNRVSPLNFLDWSEEQRAFSAMAAIAGGGRTLTGRGDTAERIPGQAVTVAFFDVLGIRPIVGRTFIPADVTPKPDIVVLGERFWRARFGGDAALVGQAIMLDSQPFTVIGITPARFQLLASADLWTLFPPRRSPEQRAPHYMQVIGRLKPGVGLEQARADMAEVAQRIAEVAPDTNKGWGVTIEPLRDAVVGPELRATSLVLVGVVVFVLLMACANVANLLLARGLGRTREIAVRAALGGSRSRILRQLLIESVLLAALGGGAGLLLAWAAVGVAPSIMPPGTLPQSVFLAFDLRVAVFAGLATLGTGLLFGLAPAWQASRIPLAETMNAGGRGATRTTGALRAVLVVGEVATAVLLVSGAGLLIRTLAALNAVDAGFRAERVLTMAVSLPISRYPTPDAALVFYQAVEREVAAIPGVRVAALGDSLPLDGWNIGQGFEVVGDPPLDRANQKAAHYQIISPDYFRALGIPVLRGRPFTAHDAAAAKQVCVVNEEFVARHLEGREPIGTLVSVQAMDPRGPTPVVREIVGVIHQVKEEPGEAERAVEIYVPIAQNPWYSASIVVQTAADPVAVLPAVKAAVARIDKDQPITQVRTMEEVAAEATSRPRFRAGLVAVFAALALALAAIGVFGVLAFSVRQRAREFGVRMALGARTADVVALVVGDAAKMTAAGVALGLAAAAALTRFLSALLFGVEPLDATTFVVTALVLTVSALVACAAPALRAARVDPAVALRQE
jgi:putative ABC transport system permease protein